MEKDKEIQDDRIVTEKQRNNDENEKAIYEPNYETMDGTMKENSQERKEQEYSPAKKQENNNQQAKQGTPQALRRGTRVRRKPERLEYY